MWRFAAVLALTWTLAVALPQPAARHVNRFSLPLHGRNNNKVNGDSRKVADLITSLIEELGLMRVLPWVQDKVRHDEEMHKLIAWVKSPAYQKIRAHLHKSPEFQELRADLKDNEGVDIDQWESTILQFVGIRADQRREKTAEDRSSVQPQLQQDQQRFERQQQFQQQQQQQPNFQQQNFQQQNFPQQQQQQFQERSFQQPTFNNFQPQQQQQFQSNQGQMIQQSDFSQFAPAQQQFQQRRFRRAVMDLLNEFLTQVDLNKAVSVLQNHIQNDPAGKKVVDYVKGDKARLIWQHMRESPEFNHIIDEELKEEGIDVTALWTASKAILRM